MKFIVAILLTAFLAYVAPLFLPWWSFAVASFVVALAIKLKPLHAFAAAFIALFLFWGIYAFALSSANQNILAYKVAQILPLNGNYTLLLIITAFAGAITAGFAALTASFCRREIM